MGVRLTRRVREEPHRENWPGCISTETQRRAPRSGAVQAGWIAARAPTGRTGPLGFHHRLTEAVARTPDVPPTDRSPTALPGRASPGAPRTARLPGRAGADDVRRPAADGRSVRSPRFLAAHLKFEPGGVLFPRRTHGVRRLGSPGPGCATRRRAARWRWPGSVCRQWLSLSRFIGPTTQIAATC